MGLITLVCGANFSERAAYIDAAWRQHWDNALLLTPTRRMARMRQEDYVRKHKLAGIWGSRAWELSAFAALLLEASGVGVRLVSALERRFIIRRTLEDLTRGVSSLPFEPTPGLVTHLLQFVTQLKQAGVEPESFRKALLSGTATGDFDALVADVYDSYQAALLSGNQYDIPGLYWEAETCCRNGGGAVPENAGVLLLDGFDDFTPSQQRFLLQLADKTEQMFIGINYDADPDRGDLFYLQQQWVEVFHKQTDLKLVTCPIASPKTYIHYAAGRIFGRNISVFPDRLESNLRIMACADSQHELESIGRKVKSLILHQQAAPSTIAVAMPDIAQDASMLASVFDEFGIPYRLQATPSLLSTAVGAVLTRLFDLFGRWESKTLVTLMTSSLVKAAPGEEAALMAIPLVVRETGVLLGRTSWFKSIEDLRYTVERRKTAGKAHTGTEERILNVLTLFEQRLSLFAALEDSLPEQATLGEFARLCDRFVDDLGMSETSSGSAMDRAALSALRGLLQTLTATAMTEAIITYHDFFILLREGMQETSVFVEGAPGASVFCCGMEGLRGETFSHVFLGGLNEGMLPRPAPQNALYSEVDLYRLRAQGILLSGRNEHTYRERTLFYHALSAAQKSITISWRKQDRTGRDALPSPFVVDLITLFGENANITLPDPGPDCFVPEAAEIASCRDLAAACSHHGIPSLVSDFPEILSPVELLTSIEMQRYDNSPPSIYDGIITSPDLLAWLSITFGPDHQFSISHLERYIEFPFNFFLERILRVRETAEVDEELDPRMRGALLHEILQRFHEHYRNRPVAEILATEGEAAYNHMRSVVEEVFARYRREMQRMPEPVVRVEAARFVRALHRYLHLEEARGEDFAPAYFETAFGRAPRETGDTLSRSDPFSLTLEGQCYKFSGKIDRIDLGEGRSRIIDYKTATAPAKKDIASGLSLQLTLYAWAVEQWLLPEHPVTEALYLPIFKTKPREALLNKKPGESDARQANARRRITTAIAGIRTGQFPPVPDESINPSQRSFPTSARFELWRIQNKFPALAESEDAEDEQG